jgi:hypothetical protein
MDDMNINRRDFIKTTGLVIAGAVGSRFKLSASRAFSVKQKDANWLLYDGQNMPFYSVALNHIDPASMMYDQNRNMWQEKYNNNIIKWLSEKVASEVKNFGFNSVGWVQEVVTRGKTNHRHSRNFTYEEYQALGMPYCHMLPFADFHQWEAETIYPDFYCQDFADWCDYIARAHCTRFANDPKLIGYFYLDVPTWIHTVKESAWKGPLFDPKKLETPAGKQELFELASQYYKITHDAIRRYDPNHLILGDRYNGQRPWAEEVVKAASQYVDVISVQHFGQPEEIKNDLNKFHQASEGLPVLLADSGVPNYHTWEQGFISNDYDRYARLTEMLQELNFCVGFHFCGAYQRNKVRKYGLLAPDESYSLAAQERIKLLNQQLIEARKQ